MPDDTAAAAADATTAAPPPAPPPARWPDWFHALDVAAAAVAVAAAFLAASFAARNSQAFLHLAGGRAVVKGQHLPGGEPFSHAGAAGRPWADPHWLFDVTAYAAYSLDTGGAALVALKAVAVAAGLILLMLLRAAGQPLLPWGLAVVLATVSSAEQVRLEPIVASVFFLPGLLVLLHRLDWTRTGWRNPLLVGGLTAVWANSDGWFLLAPVVAVAVWVGSKVDGVARPSLGRGVLAVVVGCLLNPFVLVSVLKSPGELAQLIPVETGLAFPPAAADDVVLSGITYGPFSDVILRRFGKGEDPNLPALGVLAVLSVAGAALCRSATAGLLTLVGLGVGLLNIRLAPLSAVLLVPAVGWGFNRVAGWVQPGRPDDPRTRILLTVSGLARFLVLLAGLLVGVAALPGWLHPPRADAAYGPVYLQPTEWVLDPDPSLARTATQLKDWPADRKGLAIGPDLGNYAAWFAPGVRQFANTRYGYHRADLPDLLALRAALLGRRGTNNPTQPADLDDALAACDRQGGGYVVVTTGNPPRRVDDQNLINGQIPAVYFLGLGDPSKWTLWQLDGRSAVLGRGPGGPAFDPVATAVRGGEPLPTPPTGPVPLPFTDDLIEQAVQQNRNPIKLSPPEADDAATLAGYLQLRRRQADAEFGQKAIPVRLAVVGGLAAAVSLPMTRPTTDAELALPLAAVRAARRAIAAAPDRPEPYRALLSAYALPQPPVGDTAGGLVPGVLQMGEVDAQQITAAARFLARLPANVTFELRIAGLEAATSLADSYQQTGQLDLARGALDKATELLKRLPSGGKEGDPVADERKRIETKDEELSGLIRRQQPAAERATDPAAKVIALIEAGLPGKAIDAFKKGDPSSFGKAYAPLAVQVIVAELRAGRLEDASADLDSLEDAARSAPPEAGGLAERVRYLRAVFARLAGDPRAAVAAMPDGAGATVPPAVLQGLRDAPKTLPGLAAAAGPTAAYIQLRMTEQAGRGLLGAVEMEAGRQLDRALLALLDGDPTEAARRLDSALTPLGVQLGEFNPPLADRVGRYRALVRTHARK